jgi:hypothetical protein
MWATHVLLIEIVLFKTQIYCLTNFYKQSSDNSSQTLRSLQKILGIVNYMKCTFYQLFTSVITQTTIQSPLFTS